MSLKGQLHTHSTCSDGSLSPQELADAYADLGFDFLAITDHDHLLKPSYQRDIQSIRTDLLIFPGIELTVHTGSGYVHVGRIEGDSDLLHIFNHPADYHLDLRRTISCIAEVALRLPLDAVEISHHGFYTPSFDTEEIPYTKVAADDAHDRLACGRGWIEVDAPRDRDAIIAAIRRGRIRTRFAGQNRLQSPWDAGRRFQFA